MSQADYKFCESYLKILERRYSGLNLTRITRPEIFYVEQFQDSIAPLEKGRQFKNSLEKRKLLVDVGFGGGFPILPLAYRCPSETFIGFEGKAKKVKAVREMARELGLHNVFLYHHRIEEIVIDRPCLITFKAVGSISDCLKWPVLTEQCELYFYKGPSLEDREGRTFRGGEEWKLIEDTPFKIENISRRLIGLKNLNVPCGTLRKNLVKLSSLL